MTMVEFWDGFIAKTQERLDDGASHIAEGMWSPWFKSQCKTHGTRAGGRVCKVCTLHKNKICWSTMNNSFALCRAIQFQRNGDLQGLLEELIKDRPLVETVYDEYIQVAFGGVALG